MCERGDSLEATAIVRWFGLDVAVKMERSDFK